MEISSGKLIGRIKDNKFCFQLKLGEVSGTSTQEAPAGAGIASTPAGDSPAVTALLVTPVTVSARPGCPGWPQGALRDQGGAEPSKGTPDLSFCPVKEKCLVPCSFPKHRHLRNVGML